MKNLEEYKGGKSKEDHKKQLFLEELSNNGSVDLSIDILRIPVNTVNDWLKDYKFKTECSRMMLLAAERNEAVALQRFRDGFDKPVIYRGQLCYEKDMFGEIKLDPYTFQPIVLTEKIIDPSFVKTYLKAKKAEYADEAGSLGSNSIKAPPVSIKINFESYKKENKDLDGDI